MVDEGSLLLLHLLFLHVEILDLLDGGALLLALELFEQLVVVVTIGLGLHLFLFPELVSVVLQLVHCFVVLETALLRLGSPFFHLANSRILKIGAF